MGIREQIANITCYLCADWCKDRPIDCPRRFYYADQILTILAQQAPEGLELTPQEKLEVYKSNCQSINQVVDSIAHVQLAKVAPIYAAREAEAVKKAVAKKEREIHNQFNEYINTGRMSDFERFQWQSFTGGPNG
jgi:hypothetical protein